MSPIMDRGHLSKTRRLCQSTSDLMVWWGETAWTRLFNPWPWQASPGTWKMETSKGKDSYSSAHVAVLPLPCCVVLPLLRHRSAVMVEYMAPWGLGLSIPCYALWATYFVQLCPWSKHLAVHFQHAVGCRSPTWYTVERHDIDTFMVGAAVGIWTKDMVVCSGSEQIDKPPENPPALVRHPIAPRFPRLGFPGLTPVAVPLRHMRTSPSTPDATGTSPKLDCPELVVEPIVPMWFFGARWTVLRGP